MAEIKERLALGRVEHEHSGGAASRGVARRVGKELTGTLASAVDASSDDDDPDLGPEPDDNPDPDHDEPGVLEDPPDDDLDLPDVSELDGRGGNVSRPRVATALPPDHQPRMVEKVIRDPRLAAKMKVREVAPAPNINKGNAWGKTAERNDYHERDQRAVKTANARGLVLEDNERRALEALLDLPLSDAGDLIRAVSKLSKVGVGGFNVELTQAERDEIATRAAFNNRSPEQEWAACFEFVKPMVFNAMVALAGVRDQSTGKARA